MFNDKDLNERVVAELTDLPSQLATLERDAQDKRDAVRVCEIDLKDAETEAVINAVIAGKNETERKMQQQQAIASSKTVSEARGNLAQVASELSQIEINIKQLERKFRAALALAEFQAARLNTMYRYQSTKKESNQR